MTATWLRPRVATRRFTTLRTFARRGTMAVALSLGAGVGNALGAQRRPESGLLSRRVVPAVAGQRPSPLSDSSSWWAPAASLVIPGAGQAMLRQPRAIAYVAAEAFLVIQSLAAKRDGNRDRAAYRQLAADVARSRFGGSRLGTWDYYESMEKFLESGAFDRVPGGSVDPETDPTTYNGARWLLARQNFWSNPDLSPAASSPEYQRALSFYLQSAVRDEYRWSWRDQQLQQDLYRQAIRTANRSYQRATNLAGLVAANHLASLIDAYVNVRLRRYGRSGVAGLHLDGITTGVATSPDGSGWLAVGIRAR